MKKTHKQTKFKYVIYNHYYLQLYMKFSLNFTMSVSIHVCTYLEINKQRKKGGKYKERKNPSSTN